MLKEESWEGGEPPWGRLWEGGGKTAREANLESIARGGRGPSLSSSKIFSVVAISNNNN